MAQLDRLKIQLGITGSTEDALLLELLESAKESILARRYPYSDYPVDETGVTVLETRYSGLQLKIAVYLYNKRGAEGQTAHNENGINRTYESADVPESMLREITPLVGLPCALPVVEEV